MPLSRAPRQSLYSGAILSAKQAHITPCLVNRQSQVMTSVSVEQLKLFMHCIVFLALSGSK